MRRRRGASSRRIWRWVWAAARSSSPERTAASVKPPPAKSPKEVRKYGFVNFGYSLSFNNLSTWKSCAFHQNPVKTFRIKFNQQKGRNSDSYWQKMCSAFKNSHSKFIKSLSLGGTVHMVCRNEDRANEARKDVVEQSKNEVYFQKYVQIIRKLFYMV